jgi:hypothetical protein
LIPSRTVFELERKESAVRMELELWDKMTDFVREIHEGQAAEVGGVMPPTVYAFRDDEMLGFAQLRPVYRGKDAVSGIAELSHLPAAGDSDEILVAWESQDIAVACELPALYPSCPGTSLLRRKSRKSPRRCAVKSLPWSSWVSSSRSRTAGSYALCR